ELRTAGASYPRWPVYSRRSEASARASGIRFARWFPLRPEQTSVENVTMNLPRFTWLAGLLSLAAVLALSPLGQSQEGLPGSATPPAAGTAEEGGEPLPRGPVHEAYATPVDAQPQATPVIPRQPPAPLEEVPPDQKPDGPDVVWIPGYWAWDDDRSDFIWVSGFWRAPPPERQWVPGHWQRVDGGWQGVPGFWLAAQQEDVRDLAPPPGPADAGA